MNPFVLAPQRPWTWSSRFADAPWCIYKCVYEYVCVWVCIPLSLLLTCVSNEQFHLDSWCKIKKKKIKLKCPLLVLVLSLPEPSNMSGRQGRRFLNSIFWEGFLWIANCRVMVSDAETTHIHQQRFQSIFSKILIVILFAISKQSHRFHAHNITKRLIEKECVAIHLRSGSERARERERKKRSHGCHKPSNHILVVDIARTHCYDHSLWLLQSSALTQLMACTGNPEN